jgi:arabinose-5-phosphate isomerase
MAPEKSRRLFALRHDASRRDDAIAVARDVLHHQAATLLRVSSRVDARFADAVTAILHTEGHVVVIGVGKSGQIGRKLASTFASTGTPALFVNAAEAHHGDLGMLTPRDTALLISYSGETAEVTSLLPHLRAMRVPVLALVGNLDSTLARGADLALDVSVDREACPNNLAPTSSTLATLALGDALAVALIEARGFTAADFARLHPGGALGRRLLTRVRDAMTTALPVVSPADTVGDSLMTMTSGRLGLVLVLQGERLVGLITDGDLRRAIQHHPDVLRLPVADIMTTSPVTVDANTLLDDAQARMQALKLKALVVLDGAGAVCGVVEVFDRDARARGVR